MKGDGRVLFRFCNPPVLRWSKKGLPCRPCVGGVPVFWVPVWAVMTARSRREASPYPQGPSIGRVRRLDKENAV